MSVDLSVLPNGMRVITEVMSGVRSVAAGVWIDTGSRDEAPGEEGASHFLEHLLFKGSDALSAREISERFDAMGAEANAFTTKDSTCFWVRLLDEDLEAGLRLLAEMLQHPAFRPSDVEAERAVVIEEINMNEDDPGDLAHEEFFRAILQGHPLGRPVLGTRESVKNLSAENLERYWHRRYKAPAAVLSVAGSLRHDRIVEIAERLFGGWDGASTSRLLRSVNPRRNVRAVRRDTEQAHVVYGGAGLVRNDERRYALGALDTILGGTASSRLFHAIREDRGLAYAVYSFRSSFEDAGVYGFYAGTTLSKMGTVLDVFRTEVDAVVRHGVTDEELDRAKGGMRGSMVLALEDPNSRMVRLGREELSGVEHLDLDERIAKVDAVTSEDVQAVAEVVLTGPKTLGVVGPVDETTAGRFL